MLVATIQQQVQNATAAASATGAAANKALSSGAITPRRQLVLAGGAAAVTVAMLAVLVKLCHAGDAASVDGAIADGSLLTHARSNATKTLAASLGRSLGCCRSHAGEGEFVSVVHLDVASTPLCVHVF